MHGVLSIDKYSNLTIYFEGLTFNMMVLGQSDANRLEIFYEITNSWL